MNKVWGRRLRKQRKVQSLKWASSSRWRGKWQEPCGVVFRELKLLCISRFPIGSFRPWLTTRLTSGQVRFLCTYYCTCPLMHCVIIGYMTWRPHAWNFSELQIQRNYCGSSERIWCTSVFWNLKISRIGSGIFVFLICISKYTLGPSLRDWPCDTAQLQEHGGEWLVPQLCRLYYSDKTTNFQ